MTANIVRRSLTACDVRRRVRHARCRSGTTTRNGPSAVSESGSAPLIGRMTWSPLISRKDAPPWRQRPPARANGDGIESAAITGPTPWPVPEPEAVSSNVCSSWLYRITNVSSVSRHFSNGCLLFGIPWVTVLQTDVRRHMPRRRAHREQHSDRTEQGDPWPRY